MRSKPFLSQRRILAYNRLQSDVMAMTYVVRFQKQAGPLGEQTRRACDSMIRRAHRLCIREPGMPSSPASSPTSHSPWPISPFSSPASPPPA